jgi:hypothetical protein
MELGLIKTAALMENRQGDSARFWTAYAFSVAMGFLKPL